MKSELVVRNPRQVSQQEMVNPRIAAFINALAQTGQEYLVASPMTTTPWSLLCGNSNVPQYEQRKWDCPLMGLIAAPQFGQFMETFLNGTLFFEP
ncbi:MAG: hypothetical protein K8T89_22985 [Planctomycetes bacterium]|nr:hypothetical protein [Planctomycetota bacterium]